MSQMLQKYTAFVLVILVSGCVSSSKTVAPELAGDIPDRANVIRLHSELPAADLYRALHIAFADDGFEMRSGDRELGTFSTGFKDVDQETTLAVSAVVREDGTGSIATVRGRWGMGAGMAFGLSAVAGGAQVGEGAGPAEWRKMHRSGIAFGRMVTVASRVKDARITYSKE